jgi:hypothetical protein
MTAPDKNLEPYDAFADRLACLPDEALLEASLPDDDAGLTDGEAQELFNRLPPCRCCET